MARTKAHNKTAEQQAAWEAQEAAISSHYARRWDFRLDFRPSEPKSLPDRIQSIAIWSAKCLVSQNPTAEGVNLWA